MSRSGYSDDVNQWALIRWRGMVASATRGARGQALLKDLLAALDAMPEKILIRGALTQCGQVCALGAALQYRGIDPETLPPFDEDESTGASLAAAELLNIAGPLAQEIVYENDECGFHYPSETPQQRWQRMRTWVASQIKP